jgi:putative ABC transport system substrate-binding protein
VFLFTASIDNKRFGLLHDMVPGPAPFAALVNPVNPNTPERLKGLLEAARSLGRPLRVFNATTMPEIEAAFSEVKSSGARGLFVAADPFFNGQRAAIVALTLRHTIPAIFEGREFAAVGGLMSYGTNFSESYRQAGLYTGRVLKGEKPADLPVVQSTKFEFVINLRTAKQLGLQVPPGVSAQADEVIE